MASVQVTFFTGSGHLSSSSQILGASPERKTHSIFYSSHELLSRFFHPVYCRHGTRVLLLHLTRHLVCYFFLAIEPGSHDERCLQMKGACVCTECQQVHSPCGPRVTRFEEGVSRFHQLNFTCHASTVTAAAFSCSFSFLVAVVVFVFVV